MQNINEELSGRIQTIINQTMYEKIELLTLPAKIWMRNKIKNRILTFECIEKSDTSCTL